MVVSEEEWYTLRRSQFGEGYKQDLGTILYSEYQKENQGCLTVSSYVESYRSARIRPVPVPVIEIQALHLGWVETVFTPTRALVRKPIVPLVLMYC